METLMQVLDTLEEIYREPFLLRFIQGLKPKEIADVLGRMRTGAVITKDELELYLDELPKVGDRPKDVLYKLQQIRNIFSELQKRIENQSIGGYSPEEYIPQ